VASLRKLLQHYIRGEDEGPCARQACNKTQGNPRRVIGGQPYADGSSGDRSKARPEQHVSGTAGRHEGNENCPYEVAEVVA
jgi:hypothetical protein